jgi:ubiquinone/menaquinone biosynthesis C-methylase UbiE
MKPNKEIHRDEKSTIRTFDDRTVEADYRTLIPILKAGLNVLDIGCGTGSISNGIAHYVGVSGKVTGIDNTDRFIQSGQETYAGTTNLVLIHTDLFSFEPSGKFDLIVAARVLQWLSNPVEALIKMRTMLKPGGTVSVLDYNHEAIEWEPQPPSSMLKFYRAFLKWRADAGMNNTIAEDLPRYFAEAGFTSIEVFDASESCHNSEAQFKAKAGLWSKVAGLKQIVEEGYLQENDRLKAIADYEQWIESDGQSMVMRLKEVRGKIT